MAAAVREFFYITKSIPRSKGQLSGDPASFLLREFSIRDIFEKGADRRETDSAVF